MASRSPRARRAACLAVRPRARRRGFVWFGLQVTDASSTLSLASDVVVVVVVDGDGVVDLDDLTLTTLFVRNFSGERPKRSHAEFPTPRCLQAWHRISSACWRHRR